MDYYKITIEQMNKMNILLDNIEIAKGVSNCINFANLATLIQSSELKKEVVKSDN